MGKKELVGKEVYIITESFDFEPGETVIVDTWTALDRAIGNYDPTTGADVLVFHGYLTSALRLPTGLKGRTAFLIAYDPDDPSMALVQESVSDTVDEIATEIEELLSTGVVGEGQLPFDVDIDGLHILYGYQLRTHISVSEEEVDEAILDLCQQVAEETKV
jgi:hypothetical protein